jgi:predicted permease
MAALRQDLSYTLRRFSRSPGFVLVVILSIGLGIAANTTIFSIVSTFVLRPPPVGNPSTLMSLHTTDDGGQCCNHFSQPTYEDVRSHAKSFSDMAAYYDLMPASIGGHGEPERVWGQSTTANYFDVAQMRMALGRGFRADEERQPVIVLGYRLWRRRFAADPAILGKTVNLSGHSLVVVGVTPPAFHGLELILDPEFWIPLGNVEQFVSDIPKRDARGYHWLAVIGRLSPGVSKTQAAAELDTMAKHFATAYPETDKGQGFHMEQAGSLPPRDRSAILMFLAALSAVVLLVLCIAGANVANLMLVQAAGRQREMAVRLALGATRGQLRRQLLIESVLLALGGGVLGMLLALWATSALSVFHLPAPVPLDISIHVDWRVLLYTFALSVGAGLLFGLAPAWAASRPMLANALKGEEMLSRPGRRFTLRNILVVAQIAMSIILLCGTGLFLRSLQGAAAIDIGFRSHGILAMSVDPRVHGYTPPQTIQLLTAWRDRVAALPGVVSAAVTSGLPLSGGNRSDGFSLRGDTAKQAVSAEMYMATPGYFDTMGITRLAGRDIGNEGPTAPKVTVVSRAFVQQVFGGQNPIGREVMDGDVPYRVIGVVGDVKSRTLGEDLRPAMYRSLQQSVADDPAFLGYTLLVRTSGDSAALAPAVRGAVRALDPNMAVFHVETIEEHLRDALILPRLAATLFGAFGFIGLTLAAVGLYGVMSYSVSRRTREIGIRIALGAQTGAVQRLIVRQGMVLALVALVIGLPAAFAAAKFSASVLYGVHPHDAVTFMAVPLFLTAIALLACWIPARRAAKVNPQVALRSE